MIIPQTLKIGGHIYKIEIKEMKDCGECDYANNTISLNKDHAQSQQEATLIHEIFHAINANFDESSISHMLLESLSQQFYQVLKDNNLLNNGTTTKPKSRKTIGF